MSDQLSFYSLMNNQALAIQGLPSWIDDQIIPLGIEAKEVGKFTFQISKLDQFSNKTSIYLYDALTEILTDLRSKAYLFELAEGIYEDRFTLQLITNRATNLKDSKEDIGVQVSPKNHQLHLQFANAQSANAEIAIYDISGRVLKKSNNNTSLELTIPVAQTGIYIIRVEK